LFEQNELQADASRPGSSGQSSFGTEPSLNARLLTAPEEIYDCG
jgi:hypothetical protein